MTSLLNSKNALVLCIIVMFSYRVGNIHDHEISWDAFGYYLYLPATIIHGDPLLEETDWIYQASETYGLSETVYQLSANENGDPMYFFLPGMAVFYAPGFFVAHAIALMSSFSPDGFSAPYHYVLACWMLLYAFLGLMLLRKVLLLYFKDWLAAVVLTVICLGTNFLEHTTIKGLETVNVLFLLTTAVLWYSHKWYEQRSNRHLYALAAIMALIILVKPSEVLIGFIPLFWGLSSWSDVHKRLQFWASKKFVLIKATLIGMALLSPLICYWLVKTGQPIFDSYQNPGVGLDFLQPHVIEVLFSYRKGWLLYTPVMMFSLLGFITFYKRYRALFFAFLVYFIASFWLIASWTEWWYGAGYSMRPLITAYPILALPLGSWIEWVSTKKKQWIILQLSCIALLVMFNLFQMWQMRMGIVNLTRSTSAYYWENFLSTELDLADQRLLSVDRRNDGVNSFKNEADYVPTTIERGHIEQNLTLNPSDQFGLDVSKKYGDLTSEDHVWLRLKGEVCLESSDLGKSVFVVMTMSREEGNYGYYAADIATAMTDSNCSTFKVDYLTPHIRNDQDVVKLYVWNRDGLTVQFNSLELIKFERREN